MTKSLKVIFLIWISLCNQCFAEELPRGSAGNCFYIMPLFEKLRVPGSFTAAEKKAQILKMKAQLGNGNLYHRLGFSFIYSPSVDAEVREACKLAQENGIHLGLIFALQSHTRASYRSIADKDLRQYQWRKDGVDWKGSYTSSGNIEVPEDERDYKIPTPSRYAATLREYNASQTVEWAESVKKLMADFPGVITCINGPIEEELAIGGLNNTDKLADYSPFAISEFRDWLRHSGMYDATSGKYSGEGASSLIIGDLINLGGILRSQFYDDPTPDESNGTGVSFNDFFGTNFTTWSLRYWDLQIFPIAIRDENFDCTPESGTGFCSGGFDAPRMINAGSKFWQAWSYDIPDQTGKYPAGNPESPAYGFRQNLVRNFVRDLSVVIASAGIPQNLIYAHQIPGEVLGNFTGAGGRNRSSASTIWSGFLEKSQNVGITRFGPVDPVLLTQYAGDWGIFEWHTSPNADPGTQALYNASITALNSYYPNKCHYLFPGWWSETAPDNNAIFPLNDSRFADAIRDFMQARADVPFNRQGAAADYSPPGVNAISGFVDENGYLKLRWNDRIWQDLLQKWNDWSQFSYFETQAGANGVDWTYSWTVQQPEISREVAGKELQVRIRAVAKNGLTGPWSNVAVKQLAQAVPLNVNPEFRSLYFDPGMENKVTVTPADSNIILDPSLVTVEISGEGRIDNTAPENLFILEKFWPMNSITEITGIHGISSDECSGGLLKATVSSVAPVDPYFSFTGSAVNGLQLPCVTFRLYSDLASTGQLYWFLSSGHKFTSFEIKKGWNVYSFSNLPDWISQTVIKSVRLDPGTTGNAAIALDWFAISSQPVSQGLKPSFTSTGNKISFITYPDANPGSYTVIVKMGTHSGTTTVQTLGGNQPPGISLVLPAQDTVVEAGKPVRFSAIATDSDGKIDKVRFLLDKGLFYDFSSPPYYYNWSFSAAVNYAFSADATDNAGKLVSTPQRVIRIIKQQPWSGTPIVVPGLIEAENYDTGGDHISFHDTDTPNQGGVYRADAVDVYPGPSASNGFYVGRTVQGEWLEYSINVNQGIKADISVYAASSTGEGFIHLELDDVQITNHLVVSNTGGENVFKPFLFKDVWLPSGIHKLKVVIDKGNPDLDYLTIEARNTTGANENLSDSGMLFYPNPADTHIHLSLHATNAERIEIWTMQGLLVRSIDNPLNYSQVSLLGLTPGTYLIRVISDNEIITNKLIKN